MDTTVITTTLQQLNDLANSSTSNAQVLADQVQALTTANQELTLQNQALVETLEQIQEHLGGILGLYQVLDQKLTLPVQG